MYCILERHEVAPECAAEFHAAYGPSGDWARLFARGDGFLAFELYEDAMRRGYFLTLARWANAETFEAFKSAHGEDCATIERALAPLSMRRERMGAFETEISES
jgi:heme-degrading monooxygenase HmoA